MAKILCGAQVVLAGQTAPHAVCDKEFGHNDLHSYETAATQKKAAEAKAASDEKAAEEAK